MVLKNSVTEKEIGEGGHQETSDKSDGITGRVWRNSAFNNCCPGASPLTVLLSGRDSHC